MKLKMTLMVGVLFSLLLLVSGCQNNLSENKDPDYNLVMIVSDSLRADVLSCYGGEADTPNICGLAKRGVLFENNYATAPATPASSLSIFTGNYSSVYLDTDHLNNLQKRRDEDFTMRKLINEINKLFYNVNDKEKLFAEALKEKDYEVKYDTENPFIESANKLQGFEKLNSYYELSEDEIVSLEDVTGIRVLDLAYGSLYGFLDYLLKPKVGNFFALKWILDPHSRYSPPQKFLEEIEIDPLKLPKEMQYYTFFGQIRAKHKLTPHRVDLSDYERYYLKQLYQKEVESVDERVGYILKALEYNNLLNNTLIVFVSDHGEAFGEHKNIYIHGDAPYDEQVRVPLIIAGPGIIEGRRVKDSVSLVDLMPTLVDLFGVDALTDAQGESYKSLLLDQEGTIDDRTQFVEIHRENIDAIIENNYKLITHLDANPELYNLLEDPKELNNIAADNPDLVEQMSEKIVQFKRENEIKKQQNLELIE